MFVLARECLAGCLLLLLCAQGCLPHLHSQLFLKRGDLSDLSVDSTSDLLYRTRATSGLQCGSQCASHHACAAFVFHAAQAACVLLSRSRDPGDQTWVAMPGAVSFERLSCGPPPSRPTLALINHSDVTAVYACAEDYRLVGGSVTSQCGRDKRWSQPSAECQQCVWRDFSPQGETVIPFPRSLFSGVALEATMRQGGFHVELRNASSSLRVVSFTLSNATSTWAGRLATWSGHVSSHVCWESSDALAFFSLQPGRFMEWRFETNSSHVELWSTGFLLETCQVEGLEAVDQVLVWQQEPTFYRATLH